MDPDGFPRRGLVRQRPCRLFECSETSRHWRPQTGQQQDAACNRDQILERCERVRRFRQERDESDRDESGAEAKAHQQQPGSRPTIWKGGEQTLHSTTQVDGNESRCRMPPLKECVRIPRSRDIEQLQLDDAALEPDGHSVRPVVRAKLGENVPDVTLDGFFGEG